MNYPVWNFPILGGSLVVAIIAIIHILISHLAIGGGAFLAVAEIWSNKMADGERIRKWLHKFATFFLVYTTVFGAITGVGIWFSIQLASPEATSLLIHQFVFAWATEWVTFIGELTVLYLYYYGWNSNSRRMQVFLAVAYFVIAWFSLFIINGILTFMLTPGAWTLENKDIAAGFFNPGYFPSLFIRTLTMFLIAGLAGILVATQIKDDEAFKTKIIRFSAKWVIPAAILVPGLVVWYWFTLPESTLAFYDAGMVGVDGGKMEGLARFFWLAVTSGALIVMGASVAAWKPKAVHLATAISLLLVAQVGIMGAEFFREMARKPYVIRGVLYSNALWQHNAENSAYMNRPYLSEAKWNPEIEEMSAEHGEWIYRLQCATCHTLDGYRDLTYRTRNWTPAFGVRFIEKLDEQKVMPPFQGTLKDRAALTAYFLNIHGNPVTPAQVLELYEQEERAKAAAMNANPKEAN
ncbi:MAG: cytochrome ubiquinol oxidase subunit I [Deltaproteobacteria bacterium]|nr:cytochrome ubiquinol oxidase subunit I [Deltaproteobacteria bacterium]MBN2671552.1 cytochrome ubiquinol oxidase subunit I [Deltaproteobacteria bacterium]